MDERSKIAILGFGLEGKAILEYLQKHHYPEITVCDRNEKLKNEMPGGASVQLGKQYLDGLDKFEVIFRSPGIPFLTPQIQAAKLAGAEVTSVIGFFMDQCPCPVVGVTGTKGKGTTSSLIYEMLKQSGRQAGVDVFLGGNIGRPPIEFLDQLNANCIVVLELSSFQLQDMKKSPHYAVLLNTTTDHLDYHADRDEYLRAKESLLAHQHKDCVAVLNKDYEYSKYYKPLVKGKLYWTSIKEKMDGAYVSDDRLFVGKEKICDKNEIALVGAHNIENILMAAVIAKELGADIKNISEVVTTFKNLPHRLQFVRELRGVKYFNDSYSTTPETSMAAVDSFDVPTILIAGGYDKGLDYGRWAEKILTKKSLRTVILLGQTTDKMEKALIEAEEKLSTSGFAPTKVLRRKKLEEAVVEAYAEAEEGGVVVMSPGAASFDMFENYKERGNEFIAHVRKLK
ncbi:UDP-N-acetylmuramoyl-L-alanine--D-glutamate ligase [Candidatus Peregrinibacteria bacterium]|nr:UDP-N-acetylmuramoyl-L-alanine--D-glutamate ligase [Candidatus Peregrinibacteria bacterium]